MTDGGFASDWVISFGPFRVIKARRLVERKSTPIPVGSRAFDVLAHLLEHSGEVVSNRALLDAAWPDTTVEDGSVRVQVTMLRQALGGRSTEYIVNVPGRGYCFVAPIERSHDGLSRGFAGTPRGLAPLPPVVSLIGRSESIAEISDLMLTHRILTVVGPGGIGKTSVAIAAAERHARTGQANICFVELGSVADPNKVADTFAVALGLPVKGDDLHAALVSALEVRQTLILVDGCEHLIDAVAALISRIVAATPAANFLVTSREGLRVEFERIFPLATLESPPTEKTLQATEVLSYPAAQLFLERAGIEKEVAVTDQTAALIALICARLDGLALAIEMAAGQAQYFGIEKLTQMMEDGLHLAWPGRRTAPPRHQTLTAMLEWSYRLLSDEETRVLRILSVFSGIFDLEDVLLIASENTPNLETSHVLAQLVLKSLVTVSKGARYRLLDTTRIFARAMLDEAGELNVARRRHATLYFSALRNQYDAERGEKLGRDNIEDVRSAIAWSLQNDAALAVHLVVASFPFLRNFDLSREAGSYASEVLVLADKMGNDFQREHDEQLGHVRALLFSSGFGEEFKRTWAHVQERAKHEKLDRLLVATHSLWARNNMKADVWASWKCVQDFKRDSEGTVWTGMADWMEGVASTYLGKYARAHAPLARAAAENRAVALSVQRQNLPYDCRAVGLGSFALNCLLEGDAAQAEKLVEEAVLQSRTDNLDVAMGMAEHMGALTLGFIGDSDRVSILASSLARRSKERSLTNLYHGARGYLSVIEARLGSESAFDELAERSLELERQGIDMYATYLSAERLRISIERARQGQKSAALMPLDMEQPRIGPWYFPEIYRLNGQLAALEGRHDAEDLLQKGLAVARSQASPFWELRVANDLAELWLADGRHDQARALLVAIIPKLSSNRETEDLRRARALLSA